MIVLILGSGPNAIEARDWNRGPIDKIVAINNAWRIRDDWDDLIFPEDFPEERRPTEISEQQDLIEAEAFVPAQNAFGGFLFAGATMAFTAAYWTLHTYKPKVIGFLGCDMVYAAAGSTHFYGTGTADPLRDDISLRSLEAKSARLMALAAMQGCAMINLSSGASRLVFARSPLDRLDRATPIEPQGQPVTKAQAWEQELDYTTPDGRHARYTDTADLAALDAIDQLWLEAVR
ncbi:hypothetical protein [Shimia ponticola]|uniref:hypothetical protein n=1 Tax=Shimia ponticola TaxID=2582893 RepID=UPI0011BD6070|nr:hypothetical protein [Shimia ponticola]